MDTCAGDLEARVQEPLPHLLDPRPAWCSQNHRVRDKPTKKVVVLVMPACTMRMQQQGLYSTPA